MKVQWWVYTSTLIGIAFLVDRFAKTFAVSGKSFSIIPGAMSFSLRMNSGISWSIPMPSSFLIFITVVLLAVATVCAVWAWRKKNMYILTACLCLDVGAVSNCIDRIIYGAVIDYLHFGNLFSNNIADILIVLGVSMIGAKIIITKHRQL